MSTRARAGLRVQQRRHQLVAPLSNADMERGVTVVVGSVDLEAERLAR